MYNSFSITSWQTKLEVSPIKKCYNQIQFLFETSVKTGKGKFLGIFLSFDAVAPARYHTYQYSRIPVWYYTVGFGIQP